MTFFSGHPLSYCGNLREPIPNIDEEIPVTFHATRRTAIIGAVVTASALTVGGTALASSPNSTSTVMAPHVYVASHNGDIRLPFSQPATIGHLNLPAGAFTVTAKAWMTSVAGLGNSAVYCTLSLGSKSDQVLADAQDGGVSSEPIRNEALYLTVSARVGKASQVKLSCVNSGGGNTDLKFIKITAIKVGGVTQTTF
jgi:hypothetical protein